jgi:hypothetical protein
MGRWFCLSQDLHNSVSDRTGRLTRELGYAQLPGRQSRSPPPCNRKTISTSLQAAKGLFHSCQAIFALGFLSLTANCGSDPLSHCWDGLILPGLVSKLIAAGADSPKSHVQSMARGYLSEILTNLGFSCQKSSNKIRKKE